MNTAWIPSAESSSRTTSPPTPSLSSTPASIKSLMVYPISVIPVSMVEKSCRVILFSVKKAIRFSSVKPERAAKVVRSFSLMPRVSLRLPASRPPCSWIRNEYAREEGMPARPFR